MKKKFTTTIDEKLISSIKINAIENNTSVGEILEKLIDLYLKGEINISENK